MTSQNADRDALLERLHKMEAGLSIIKSDLESTKKYYEKIDQVLDKMHTSYVSIAVQEQKIASISHKIQDMENLVKDSIATVKTEMRTTLQEIQEEHKEIRKDLKDVREKVDYFDQIKWKVLGAISAFGLILSVVDFKDILKMILGG